mgnify:FL=1
MSENSSSVVRAYTQAEYDNVDLLSTLDTKIWGGHGYVVGSLQ